VLNRDLIIALRGFRRTPAFFVTTVATLGLAVGMSVAMFTVFRGVLLRRLPVVDQDRIVVMNTWREPGVEFAAGTKQLAEIRRGSRTMRDVAGVAHFPATGSPWLDRDRAITLNRSLVTGNFFDVLGAKPALGRLLRPDDDDVGPFQASGANSSKLIVLSYAAWQKHFAGDSAVIGRRLIDPFRRWVFTIVGVGPPGLDYPAGVEYWTPIWGGWESTVSTFAVARLAPNATIAMARDEYLARSKRVGPQFDFRGADASTFTQTVLGDVRPVLTILTAAVSLLLLIACVNVGNLLLLRAAARTQEIAVRRALGAGYGDIVRQLLVEACVLAATGGLIGFALAGALLRLLIRFAPAQLPRLDEVALTRTPILTAIAVCGLTVVLFGIGPALVAGRSNLVQSLRSDSRSGTGTAQRRMARQLLVAMQVALAMVMLAGAALLTRTLERLERQDLGYQTDHLSVLTFTYNAMRFDSTEKLLRWGDRAMERIRAIPGVTVVSPILIPPMLGTNVWHWRWDTEGQSAADAAANPTVPVEAAGADFFQVFRIPLVAGRPFSQADREDAPLVAIVSESVARHFWPGESPIGKRIRTPPPASFAGGSEWRTVVGVVRDNHLRALRSDAPAIYLPWHQSFWQPFFAIRSSAPLSALRPTIASAIHEVDAETDLVAAQTMDELLAKPLAQPRLGAILMSGFSVVALLLSAIGLFGVMSAMVREQRREIGIRLALGAQPKEVRRRVVGHAMTLAGTGAVVGLAGAVVGSRVFVSLLYHVSPIDPISLGAACTLLIGVALAATYLPARRATLIDPVEALRSD
jgi:predicted permease